MPATTGQGRSENGANGQFHQSWCAVADRVYEMLRLEMKLDNERQRLSRRHLTNRQKRGR